MKFPKWKPTVLTAFLEYCTARSRHLARNVWLCSSWRLADPELFPNDFSVQTDDPLAAIDFLHEVHTSGVIDQDIIERVCRA
jgi:hypothetical protein